MYTCPFCKTEIPDGIESLVNHRMVECDVQWHRINTPEFDEPLSDEILIEKTKNGPLYLPRWIRDQNPEEYERVIRKLFPEAREN